MVRDRLRAARRLLQIVAAVAAVSAAALLATAAPASPFREADAGWNTAGVGEVTPTTVSDLVRTGSRSTKVELRGSQERSELSYGAGGAGDDGTIEFREGDERFYAFSINVREMVYGEPGAHNLVMQFKSDGEGSPKFGLQLWDENGRRGLWSHGDAMDEDRYLAPFAHGAWHDLLIHFKASSQGRGFYRLYLDGRLIDERRGVSMIEPGREFAYIKNGIYRKGEAIPGTSEIRLDAARLGSTREEVRPW
jgi:hypothetical protein